MATRKKRAIILTRVSTDKQENDRQVSELKKFAKKEMLNVVEVIEEKVSGSKSHYADRSGLPQPR